MITRKEKRLLQTEEGDRYLRTQKLVAALYLSGLDDTEDFMELFTHLDYETIEKIAAASETTLLDREYNK